MESPQKFFWPNIWQGKEREFLFLQKGQTLREELVGISVGSNLENLSLLTEYNST